MACYHPIGAWKSTWKKANGKSAITTAVTPSGSPDQWDRIQLPCGQCIGCRLAHSREWALRCMHEAYYHEEVSFLTLTYEVDPVTLDHEHFQLFMKRLRKAVAVPLRYYMCGEYGSVYDESGNPVEGALGRPHFHAILYGYSFPDRVPWSRSGSGQPLYNSPTLDRTWGNGYATTQDFSVEAAAYVARYVLKKVNGGEAKAHYEKLDKATGEVVRVAPEYTRMSLRPGIGSQFIQDYTGDVYPKDFVTLKGEKKFRPPKYYDKFLEENDPEMFAAIKEKRRKEVTIVTQKRLEQIEQCKLERAKKLKRPIQ